MNLPQGTQLYGLPLSRYEGITATVEFTTRSYVQLSYDRPVLYRSGITVTGEPLPRSVVEIYFTRMPVTSLFDC